MKIKCSDFGLIFWIHILVVFLLGTGPFLFNWKIVSCYIGLFYVQHPLLGSCFLTRIQFKTKNKKERESFSHYYLSKMGFKFDNKKVKTFVGTIPLVLLIFSIIWQILLEMRPLIF